MLPAVVFAKVQEPGRHPSRTTVEDALADGDQGWLGTTLLNGQRCAGGRFGDAEPNFAQMILIPVTTTRWGGCTMFTAWSGYGITGMGWG